MYSFNRNLVLSSSRTLFSFMCKTFPTSTENEGLGSQDDQRGGDSGERGNPSRSWERTSGSGTYRPSKSLRPSYETLNPKDKNHIRVLLEYKIQSGKFRTVNIQDQGLNTQSNSLTQGGDKWHRFRGTTLGEQSLEQKKNCLWGRDRRPGVGTPNRGRRKTIWK